MHLEELTDRVEAVSATYARKYAIERDASWLLLKLHEEVGELTQAFLTKTGQARDRGRTPEQVESDFRDELADVFCQTLLLARHHGVDLEQVVADKWLVWQTPA
ncbi:MazG nucleotide pyrophosphohydrolase domain-containing protein [Nocardia bovistercoris]|uniref:Pyrophosphatase n=1 Tax=Nocardia bovistercoris TaxID=2785916 RepID=A0A931IFV2_9NOCA|nr:MazG nucleotide pyrophosphohydrolase domain-containing protein [Nocardia bovistercoris]MBH0779595.1 pyrophosphatase [Nocardia bovistercoris]